MPRILVTNDDGYDAPSLHVLARALKDVGEVVVFAPDHNWSAAGHTRTMHKPLRITESSLPDGTPLYITTGTPSDCVCLALLRVPGERPDLVVSGINMGANIGHDITYSGTVAAAMEGAVYGVMAMAVSQDYVLDADRRPVTGDPSFAAGVAARIASQALRQGLPFYSMLNVNIPALPPAEIRGIQVTRLGRRIYNDVLVSRADPRGRPYYWIGGDPPTGEPEEGTDVGALAAGYVSVTPLNLDMTDRSQLARLATWDLQLDKAIS